MSQAAATKPAPTEHAPEFSQYVTLVAEGDIIQTLEQQIENSLSLLRTIPSDKANFRYAPSAFVRWLSELDLLPRGRQGRTLCRVGAAATFL